MKFAFWTYVWTLVLMLLLCFVTEFSNRASTGPEIVWHKPEYYWGILKGFCPMPLPIFPAALLGFTTVPRWNKALTLLLMPFLLAVFCFRPVPFPTLGVAWLMTLILPTAALASVPDLIRQYPPPTHHLHYPHD